MSADILAIRLRYAQWASQNQTSQASRFGMPQISQGITPFGIPQQQAVQHFSVQEPSNERKAVEWLWGKVDPDALKLFKLSEKMIESPYPVIRLAGGLLFLKSLFKTADTIDKKLDN